MIQQNVVLCPIFGCFLMVKTKQFLDITKTNLLILSVRLLSVAGAILWVTNPNLYIATINKEHLIFIYNGIIFIYVIFFILRFIIPKLTRKCEYFCLFTFIFDQMVISYFTYNTGGFSSPFYSGYFVVITFSAFVLGTRMAVITALSGAMFYIAFNFSYGVGLYNLAEILYRVIPFFIIAYPTGVLSDRIENHLIEIKKLNEELKVKNRKLEETLNEIEVMQKQLIKREKEKAMLDLAESVAHRLRNPMMSIGGIATILDRKIKKGADKQEILKYVEYIKNESKQMSELLNNLLEMSRTELELSFISVEKLIKSLLEEFKDRIEENLIDIKLEIESQIPPVRTDKKKLTISLRNIIDNCIKAMKHGGELYIGVKRSEAIENAIEIIIRDTGPGIPKDILNNIFKPFESGGAVKKGIGLPLAKHSIELLGGELYIESEIGIGTTFKIILPM